MASRKQGSSILKLSYIAVNSRVADEITAQGDHPVDTELPTEIRPFVIRYGIVSTSLQACGGIALALDDRLLTLQP